MRIQVVAADDPVEAFFACRSVQALQASGAAAPEVRVLADGAPGAIWDRFRAALPGVAVTAGRPDGPAVPAGAVLKPGGTAEGYPEAVVAGYATGTRDAGDHGGYWDLRPRINAVGLMDVKEFRGPERALARQLNAAFQARFDNALFWSYRYAVNPELGSGKGSRGVYVGLKRACLKAAAIERAETVLDVGCGDLEVVHPLALRGYLGLDLAETALTEARRRRPDWAFEAGMPDPVRHGPREVVLCLDVLIHQRDPSAYAELVAALVAATGARLIVSGYEASPGDGYMIGFHAPLSETLAATGAFESIVPVARYRQTALFVADRAESPFPPAAPLDMLGIGEIVFDYLDGLKL